MAGSDLAPCRRRGGWKFGFVGCLHGSKLGPGLELRRKAERRRGRMRRSDAHSFWRKECCWRHPSGFGGKRGGEQRAVRGVFMRLEESRAMPIVALSDLHVDHPTNRAIVQKLGEQRRREAIVVAGDISHDMDLLEESLRILGSAYARVFFVCGNHELWVRRDSTETSLEKYEEIMQLCDRIGILWQPHRLGSVIVHPIPSWYDTSLELPVEGELYARFESYECLGGKYPSKVAAHFAYRQQADLFQTVQCLQNADGALTALTFSHFLPGRFALPDWIEPEQDSFHRSWMVPRGTSVSAKFSRVAGSVIIEELLRRLTPHAKYHLHCFGHSHRPKDFVRQGVRYVHHPLAKPKERERFLAPPECTPKPLIDAMGVPVPASRIFRYWEQVLMGQMPA